MSPDPQLVSVEVSGCTVNIRKAGQGQSIVYLHDELSSEWNEFLDLLSSKGKVSAIELPGFGVSARPSHVETVEDLAFLLGDVLDEISRETPVAVVGASLGGWIALETAIRAHHAIGHLVLIGAAGLATEEEVPTDYFVLTSEERTALLFERPDSEPKVDEDSWIRNSSMTARLVWQPRYVSPKLKYRLHRLRQPSLVLWGDRDRFLSNTYGEALAKTLGAPFQVVRGSGHFPVWDAPRDTASQVLDFLQKERR